MKVPGWYELVSQGNGGDASILAALIAESFKNVLWISSGGALDCVAVNMVTRPVVLLNIDRVDVAFEAIKTVEAAFDLIVLDSLAGLRPGHSQANNIAPDVQRGIFGWSPSVPVLVTNQQRYPIPLGGLKWRLAVRSRTLFSIYESPMISALETPGKFLFGCPCIIWQPGDRFPVFRRLMPDEVADLKAEDLTDVRMPRTGKPWLV